MMRIVMVIAALLGASTALAFEYSDTCGGNVTRWAPGNPNTVWRWSTSYPSADIGASTARAVIQSAFDEWSRPGCSEFDANQGTTTTSDPGGSSSSHIVGFYESGWPAQWGSSTLALTLTSYSPSSCLISGSDMIFNGDDWDFTTGSSAWDVDLQAVATHEAGHWLGLDHSNHPGSSLWPSWSGGTDERTLSCDDTEAVCGNHPSGGNSCTDDEYCACGTGCHNGTCSGTVPVDPGPGACDEGATSASESEPNDWIGEEDVDYFAPTRQGDFTISGSVTCGNNGQQYTGDSDWSVIDFECADRARFVLDWNGSADLDFYVWDTSSNNPFALHNEAGNSGPVSDDAEAGGRIFTRIACWSGSGTINYTFTIDWEPFAGTTEPTDPCQGLTWEGECQGDVAVWCQDNEIQQYDCSDEGGCGLTEEYGYFCLGADGDPDTSDPGDTGPGDTGPELPWIPGCAACSSGGAPAGGWPLALLLAVPAIRRRPTR